MEGLWEERSLEPERMDLEPIDRDTAVSILGTLEKINAWLGGVHATLYHVQRFARDWKSGERTRFIDWGTGGADLPRALVRWGRKNGFAIEVVGVDSNPSVVEVARETCRGYPEIRLVQADFLTANPPLPPFAKGGSEGGFTSRDLKARAKKYLPPSPFFMVRSSSP